MSEPTPEQIEKLPKWAQDHIRRLKVIAEGAQERLAPLKAAAAEARIVVAPYDGFHGVSGAPRALEDHEKIQFRLDSGGLIHVGFRRSSEGLRLEIMSVDGRQLIVRPSVTNVVFIDSEK